MLIKLKQISKTSKSTVIPAKAGIQYLLTEQRVKNLKKPWIPAGVYPERVQRVERAGMTVGLGIVELSFRAILLSCFFSVFLLTSCATTPAPSEQAQFKAQEGGILLSNLATVFNIVAVPVDDYYKNNRWPENLAPPNTKNTSISDVHYQILPDGGYHASFVSTDATTGKKIPIVWNVVIQKPTVKGAVYQMCTDDVRLEKMCFRPLVLKKRA